jgi:hypothetical protein
MTKNDWLNVAMVIAVIMTAIATLLGPVLGIYVQSRMSQTTLEPKAHPPNDPLHRLILQIRSRWQVILAMALSLLVAGLGLHRSKTSVDVWTIWLMATGISVYFSVTSYLIVSTAITRSTEYLYALIEKLKSEHNET